METFDNFLVNNYPLLIAFHVISMVAWMAAMLYLPRLFVYHTMTKKDSETSKTLKVMEYRLQKFIMNPSMILTILFGTLLLKTNGVINWEMSWIYYKLLAVIILLIIHALLGKFRKDFYFDRNIHTARFYKLINEIPTVLLIIIILLVYLKPF